MRNLRRPRGEIGAPKAVKWVAEPSRMKVVVVVVVVRACKRSQEPSRMMMVRVRVRESSSDLRDGAAPGRSGSRSGDNSGQNSQVSRSCTFMDNVRLGFSVGSL